MAEKEKPSDAVRITRIVAPTVLIIALALIFKSEFGNVVNRGCFDLKLEQAGLGLSDKSLCTKEDFEETKDTLIMAGARQAEEAAAESFKKYESRIAESERMNVELAQNLRNFQREIEIVNRKQSEYKAALQSTLRRANSQEAKQVANLLAEQFAAIYGEEIELATIEPVEIVDPKVVAEQNAAIRQDYIKTSRSNVNRVQENVTIQPRERRK